VLENKILKNLFNLRSSILFSGNTTVACNPVDKLYLIAPDLSPNEESKFY
jgi:hypothetical protein